MFPETHRRETCSSCIQFFQCHLQPESNVLSRLLLILKTRKSLLVPSQENTVGKVGQLSGVLPDNCKNSLDNVNSLRIISK